MASVAIPKLTATRDDAVVTRAQSDFATLVKDLGSYYTSRGTFDSAATGVVAQWRDRTNVNFVTAPTANNSAQFAVGNIDPCVTITLTNAGGQALFAPVANPAAGSACEQFLTTATFRNLPDNGANKQLLFGGSSVVR